MDEELIRAVQMIGNGATVHANAQLLTQYRSIAQLIRARIPRGPKRPSTPRLSPVDGEKCWLKEFVVVECKLRKIVQEERRRRYAGRELWT